MLSLGLLLGCATVITHLLWALKGSDRLRGEDIYHVWMEGQRIVSGINPYARILGGSLRENDNYPTYLPLSYLFAAAIQWLGAKRFDEFIKFWRPINLACHLWLAWLIASTYLRKQQVEMAFAAASIIMLGRWSGYIVNVQQLEFAAIGFLILAGLLSERRPWLSAAMLGLSLSIKHLGAILLPAFLIQLANKHEAPLSRAQGIQRYCLLLGAIPTIISIPFIATCPEGFLLNMVFSISRSASSHGLGTGSRSLLLGQDGARIFLLAQLAIILLAQAKKKISFWMSCSFSMLAFLQLNPVIFGQYYIWLLSISLIAVADFKPTALALQKHTIKGPFHHKDKPE